MHNLLISKKRELEYLLLVLLCILLYYISKQSYLIFHTITEMTTIILGISLMLITFVTIKISNNNFFQFLGIVFGLVAVIDLFHLLTYKGMNIFSTGSNMTVQLKILGRFYECIMLNISFLCLNKKFNCYKVFLVNALIISFFLISIIVFKNFPICYIEGYGLTLLKRLGEWAVTLGFLTMLVIVIRSKINISIDNKFDLVTSIILEILSSLCFALYIDSYGTVNLFGHLFKYLSYYYMFKIIIKCMVVNPYSILFETLNNKINQSENANKELVKTKEKVQVIEELYNKFINFVPDGILVIRDEKIEFVNDTFLNMLKIHDKNKLMNMSIFDLVDKSYYTILESRISVLKKTILEVPQEYEFIWEGNKKWVEVASLIINDQSGEYMISTIRNIEDRKKAEESEQLLKLKNKEEKIKNDFFTNISHELRTPINLIYSALQVENDYLKNDVNKEIIIKYNKIIRQNSLRLIRLINNMIDITKIETCSFKPSFKIENIVNIVENITMSIVEYVENKKFTLVFDTEIEEAYVMCDSELIERIMLNILSNAVKYGKEYGNIEIYISRSSSSSVSISIKDDGIGIPDEMKEKIFDRFLKVDTSLSRNTEGSGIGLAIVKELVEMHEGTITYKSELNCGTEFKITLPTLEYASEVCVTLEESINYKKNIIETAEIEFSDIYD